VFQLRFFVSLLFLVALLSVSGCGDEPLDVTDVVNQFDIGELHYNGLVQPQDYKEAMKWFRMAAEQGHAGAQFNLGYMYNEGQGVAQDSEESTKWYRLAAEQGHSGAQFNLGNMYANGEGVAQDYKEAYIWLSIASVDGFELAKHLKQKYGNKLSPEQLAEAQGQATARFNQIEERQ
jgi:uncharacterized protein